MPDITIAGLTPFSMVDWPGRLVATVFTKGCSWNCPYCHNPGLRGTTADSEKVPWEEVTGLARRRRGLLDGFVFSGGEPTRQRGLPAAIRQVRELGFAVGLHTNGMYPALLARILDRQLVDWVGLDIKAAPQPAAYGQAIGASSFAAAERAAGRAWRSLELLQAAGCDFEVRTTVFDCPEQLRTLPKLADQLADAGVDNWVLQRSRGQGTAADFCGAADVVKHERAVAISDAIATARRNFPDVAVR
ncbi:anaerobic ribonucleoside-triphosphate reductase activating protein [Corynebacterium sp. 5QC2CO]|uniref:anaerobic ribonucleoside-triphosphate reductase activating protein n=1 Tax=Corynebacterium sp. 5QC2CO TaxID=2968468 RepID=UPI00211BE672|nr:anaerobic ribonucleoside-triphosphate reductase activating protein [Corynebacterium sp. 5QC2CO]MCQ9350167.1 anaerobic ribonucleoside-triphosphate reductase activating protein [Corynebacterium sp. 5QC2CO]